MGLLAPITGYVQSLFEERDYDPEELIAAHTPAQLSAFLPYRAYDTESGLYVNNDGYGFVIEFSPMVGADQQTHDVLKALLSISVPDEVSVQLQLYSSPCVGHLLNYWAGARGQLSAHMPLVGDLAAERAAYLAKGAHDSLSRYARFYLRNHRCFFSVSKRVKPANEDEAVAILSEYKEQVLSTLRQVAGFAEQLDPKDFVRLLRHILNPSLALEEDYKGYDPAERIDKQIIWPDTSYRVSRTKISTIATRDKTALEGNDKGELNYIAEEMNIAGFEAQNLVTESYLGHMSRLIGDIFTREVRHQSPFMISLNIDYPKAEAAKQSAEFKAMRARQVAEGPMGRYMPRMQKRSDDYAAHQDQIVRGARPVQYSLTGFLTARPKDFTRSIRHSINAFAAAGVEMRKTDMVHPLTLLYSLPMMGETAIGRGNKSLGRKKSGNSFMVPVCAPLFGEFAGENRPGMCLIGRLGTPFFFCNFASEGQGNFNVVVTGASGSGKSFMMNDMVLCQLGLGGKVFIVDDGYSFRNQCRVLGGNHYEFTARSAFCLNPFDLIYSQEEFRALAEEGVFEHGASYEDYLNERLEAARQVFCLMVFGDGKIGREQAGFMSEAVRKVWDNYGQSAGADEIYAFIEGREKISEQINPASMCEAMRPYVGKGIYARFFNGKNTLKLDKSINVFELSPLEHKRELRSIIVSALFSLIDLDVTRNRKRKDLILLDEAWKALGSEALSETIMGWARRLRKYGAGLVVGTQGASDFNKNEAAKQVLANSEWKIVLNNSTTEYQVLADMDVFKDDYALRLARDIKVSPGEYSEMLVICDRYYALGRLVVDPVSAVMFSTDARVVDRIEEAIAGGVDALSAIRQEVGRQDVVRQKEGV